MKANEHWNAGWPHLDRPGGVFVNCSETPTTFTFDTQMMTLNAIVLIVKVEAEYHHSVVSGPSL